jgi:hypothetical protein
MSYGTALTTAPLDAKPAPAAARSPGAITRRPLVRHGLDAAAGVLHVGTESIRLADVASYSAAGLSEKDLSTAFATIALFSAISAVFIFLVVEIGWRVKFMLEGILFGLIAFCAVAELFSARRNTLYTFKLTSGAGAVHTFVTADRIEAETVKGALDAAGCRMV